MCGSRGKPQSLECVSVCLLVCFCALVGVCVWGKLGDIGCCTFTVRGWEALSWHGLRRPGQEGSGSSGVICRCVLVRAVKVDRWRRGGGFLLEEDALSFLHPRVVLHQLRVEEGILWDAVLYPLYQASWRDRKRGIFQIPEEVTTIHPLSTFPLFHTRQEREGESERPEVTNYILVLHTTVAFVYFLEKVLFYLSYLTKVVYFTVGITSI